MPSTAPAGKHAYAWAASFAYPDSPKRATHSRALGAADYSREALELDDLRRTWIAATNDMEALAAHAALRQDAERMLSAERAG
ncbi:hypothetical protein [Streptomyces albidoflavus]|uniref:hypothetical protein n=1 Tax=Streptomyces albidoflavus TaxID=1886 RepID=UPI0033C0877F